MAVKTAVLALCLTAAASCNRKVFYEEFSKETEIGMKVKGVPVLEYSPENCQIGYNSGRIEFWVTEDKMADYFIIRCDRFPEKGATVKADITYTTYDNIINKTGISFQVTEADQQTGKIWLWNQSGKIGVVVKCLY